jgi:hypothetical protein
MEHGRFRLRLRLQRSDFLVENRNAKFAGLDAYHTVDLENRQD